MEHQAYWISPRNRVIPVPHRHIIVVCENPALFGLTPRYVEREFAKTREARHTEGHARQIIMARIIQSGWIRLRYEPKDYSLTVQFRDIGDPRRRGRALRAVQRLLDQDLFPKHIAVRLLGLGEREQEILDPDQFRAAIRKLGR